MTRTELTAIARDHVEGMVNKCGKRVARIHFNAFDESAVKDLLIEILEEIN